MVLNPLIMPVPILVTAELMVLNPLITPVPILVLAKNLDATLAIPEIYCPKPFRMLPILVTAKLMLLYILPSLIKAPNIAAASLTNPTTVPPIKPAAKTRMPAKPLSLSFLPFFVFSLGFVLSLSRSRSAARRSLRFSSCCISLLVKNSSNSLLLRLISDTIRRKLVTTANSCPPLSTRSPSACEPIKRLRVTNLLLSSIASIITSPERFKLLSCAITSAN